MAQFSQNKFADSTEVLDGNNYDRCEFTKCRIVYRGGEVPVMNSCQFTDCQWAFEEAADRTMNFLRSLYHGMGPGGQKMVDDTFAQLRRAPAR